MLLKNLRIVTSTTLNDQTQNIRITDGLIAEIGPKLRAQDGEQVHDFQGAYVSPGWMDMHVHLREPAKMLPELSETGPTWSESDRNGPKATENDPKAVGNGREAAENPQIFRKLCCAPLSI